MKKPFLVGLIAGLAAIIPHLFYFFGLLPNGWSLGTLIPFEILLILLTVPISVYLVKGQHEKGQYFFAEAFKAGMQTAGMGALILAAFTYIYFSFIDLETVSSMINTEVSQLEAQGMSQEEIGQIVEGRKQFLSPAIQSIFPLIFTLFGGGIFSLFSSLIFARFPR